MRRSTRRIGFTLVETLVAIVLLLALVTIGGVTTRATLVVQSRTAALDARSSAMTDALRTLERHVTTADPAAGDIRAARDTMLDLVRTIGLTTICRIAADTLLVTSGADPLPWATALPRSISAGDEVRLWHEPSGTWIARRVASATSAATPCGDSSGAWPGRATQRLIVDATTAGLHPGTPVRVTQREKWSLVRGGDGNWSLSLATWDVARAAFATPQPLLAQLAAPSGPDGPGLTFHAIDGRERRVADSALVTTRSVLIIMRSARHPRIGTLSDSVRINVGAH